MEKKICIWGDSIVYGAGDFDLGGWANRLTLYLRKKDRAHRVYNLGISGEISSETLKRFKVEAEAREPKTIIFAIGINDTVYLEKDKKVRIDIAEFKNNIKELINKARKFSNDIIFLNFTPVDESKTNPIPWHTDRSYNNQRIEEYNKELYKIANENNLKIIDIYNIFKAVKDYKKLLYDGLHPNSEGHELIFNAVKEILKI